MLLNDPPPGTRIRKDRDRRMGKLVRPSRPLRKGVDRPYDEFIIELDDGKIETVRRDEITRE